MIQRREQLRLALEPDQAFRIARKRIGQHFDGDVAVQLHVARTVCRRAERRIVALMPPVDAVLLRYMNRLSDLLFVFGRVVNHRSGIPETEW